MAFIPLNEEEGKVVSLPAAASTTFTKYDGVKFASGYASDTATGDAFVDYIALETKTTGAGDGAETIRCLKVDPSVRIKATLSTTFVQATHAGNRYDITGAGTIDLAATTDKVFLLEKGSGTVGEGYFQQAIA